MISCCVRTCVNGKKCRVNKKGVLFHMSPRDQKYRMLWLKALALPTMPGIHPIVCSDHFTEADYQVTKTGLRCLNATAVPSVKLSTPEAPMPLPVCKVCLAMDVKMHPLKDSQLHTMYEDITGVTVCEETGLQSVCWECATQLSAAAGFKKKAVLTDHLLNNLLREIPNLKLQDIVTLKQKYDLKSNLAIQRLIEKQEIINPRSSIKTEIAFTETDESGDSDIQDDEIDLTVIKSDESEINDIHNDETDMKVIQSDELRITTIQDDEIDLKVIQSDESEMNEIKDDETVFTAIQNDEPEIEIQDIYKPVLVYNETGMLIERIESFKSNYAYNVVDLKTKREVGLYKNDVSEDISNKLEFDEDFTVDSKRTGSTSPIDSLLIKKAEEVKKNEVLKVRRQRNRHPIDEDKFTITKLTYEEQLERIQRRAESPRFKAAEHKCYLCFKLFLSQDKLALHALTHSEQRGAHECPVCKNRFKTARAMRSHVNERHAAEYRCKLCPFVTTNRWPAFYHIKYHTRKSYTCKHCNCEFSIPTSYLSHLRLKHMSDCVCELCGYTFVSMRGVEAHKRLKHPLDANSAMEGPYCKICDVQFMSETAHRRHLSLSSKHVNEYHPNRLSNDSSKADRRIRREYMRSVSIPGKVTQQAVKPPGTVTCEQCGVVLPDFRSYRWHFKREHPGMNRTKYRTGVYNTPFMCDQCGKIFMSKFHLLAHMTAHTGSKPYQCDHCNKTFSVKTRLASHMKVHDVRRRKYECHVCGNTFTFATNMKRHMLLHTGLKPYKCDVCEKCFVTSDALRAHVDHVHLQKPRPKRVRRKVKKNEILSDDVRRPARARRPRTYEET